MDSKELQKLQAHFPHAGKSPELEKGVWLAPSAQVMGDVVLGEESSVWFGSVLRGDVHHIRVGARTNIQDLTMVHVSYEHAGCEIGSDVSVGHSAILHGCSIGDHCLIGMGSQILDHARIEDWVLLGAGSLVTPGTVIPSGHKAMGRPARVVAPLTEKEREWIKWNASHYVKLKNLYQNCPAPFAGTPSP